MLKKLLLPMILLTSLFFTACGSDDSSNNNNTATLPQTPTLTPIDNLTTNPFSLLGIYKIDNYTIDNGALTTPMTDSEMRVNVSVATTTTTLQMRVLLDSKQTADMDIPINVPTTGDFNFNSFVATTFGKLGAQPVTAGGYNLTFVINPSASAMPEADNAEYQKFIDAGIITAGQTITFNVTKTKNLTPNLGLN